MFVKDKGAFQFERPHDGEACAVGKTEIFVAVSFKNSKSLILNRRGNRGVVDIMNLRLVAQ
jgi:hypothetical protein